MREYTAVWRCACGRSETERNGELVRDGPFVCSACRAVRLVDATDARPLSATILRSVRALANCKHSDVLTSAGAVLWCCTCGARGLPEGDGVVDWTLSVEVLALVTAWGGPR